MRTKIDKIIHPTQIYSVHKKRKLFFLSKSVLTLINIGPSSYLYAFFYKNCRLLVHADIRCIYPIFFCFHTWSYILCHTQVYIDFFSLLLIVFYGYFSHFYNNKTGKHVCFIESSVYTFKREKKENKRISLNYRPRAHLISLLALTRLLLECHCMFLHYELIDVFSIL